MNVGALRHLVSLSNSPTSTPDSDGFYEDLNPPKAWAAIQPLSPQNADRVISHLVRMRYHPQVTFETRILFGERSLFVKGFQNVDERNDELVLLCEEVR